MTTAEMWHQAWRFGDCLSFEQLLADLAEMPEFERDKFCSTLRHMHYEFFLKTRYWTAITKHLEARRRICETCGKRGMFEVHHRSYEHRGQEHEYLNELKLLCSTCHAIITEAVATVLAQAGAGGLRRITQVDVDAVLGRR